MWPKILIELIPHISRLVPMADKFFSSRSANDEATQQAVAALRSDLAQTASTHAALYRQMNEQSERVAEAAADAHATRAAVDVLDAKVERLERTVRGMRLTILTLLLITVTTLIATLATLLIISTAHH